MDKITFQEEANGDVVAYRGQGRIRVLCYSHQTGDARLQAIAQGAFMIGMAEQRRKTRDALHALTEP